jgi:CheY-like chemotaxis protein
MFRVGIVDEHEDTRSLLRLWLEDKYEVSDYPTAEELISDIRRKDFHLLLLGLKLRNSEGTDIVEAIRKLSNRPRPVLIALTASAFASDRERARGLGFDDYMVKPIDLERLRNTMAKYLD